MANYILLERIELNASAASISFTNIPQSGYTDLKIVVSARNDDTSGAESYYKLSFNSVATNYSRRTLYAASNSPLSDGGSSETAWNYLFLVSDTSTANTFSNSEIYIPNYTGSQAKSASVDQVVEKNASTGAVLGFVALLNPSTAAINSLTLTPHTGALAAKNFVANSTFSLYGLAAVGTTPVIAPKASGGNIIDYDGTYWIHTFTTSGAFVPQTGLTCDYLVIAGGGGGSSRDNTTEGAGGGGAGGYLTGSTSVSAISYTVTVGAGSAGVGQATASNGSNSVFGAITATGGGGGGAGRGGSGGSGGGSGSSTPPVGLGTAGQGNNGGAKGTQNNGFGQANSGGGGGGASAVGQTPSTSSGGNGGAGSTSSITGTSVGRGGGGGGAGATGGTATDGGGAGTIGAGGTQGTSGTVNTGGGGGARNSNSGTVAQGGNGGSGIVIIRYLA